MQYVCGMRGCLIKVDCFAGAVLKLYNILLYKKLASIRSYSSDHGKRYNRLGMHQRWWLATAAAKSSNFL